MSGERINEAWIFTWCSQPCWYFAPDVAELQDGSKHKVMIVEESENGVRCIYCPKCNVMVGAQHVVPQPDVPVPPGTVNLMLDRVELEFGNTASAHVQSTTEFLQDDIARVREQYAITSTLVQTTPAWTAINIPRAGDVKDHKYSRVEEVLVDWLVKTRVPGASLCIIGPGGEPVLQRAFGFSDLETQTPMLPTHGVGIGSIGKTIHTACLLALVDDGLLSLDDTLGSLFGIDEGCDAYTTTIRQCLQHTTGFTDAPDSLPLVDTGGDAPRSMLNNGKRAHAAGSKYEYCDNIYSVLHLVIGAALQRGGRTEEASNIPKFIETRVLAKVGAADDVCWMGDARMPSMADVGAERGRLARGYTVVTNNDGETTCKEIAHYNNFNVRRGWSYGASGFTGTTLGVARAMQAFGGDSNRQNSKVLMKETIDAAFEVSPPGHPCGLNIMPYGFTRDGGMIFGHGGSNGAVAVVLPDGSAAACVVTGTLGLSGWDTSDHSQLGKVEDVLGFWLSAVGPTLSEAYTS